MIIERDIVCAYARTRLAFISTPDDPVHRKAFSVQRWSKPLTMSDAQRKKAGNQRGGITLTQAGMNIKPQTYFRRVLFGDAEWVPSMNHNGFPLETAVIGFNTRVFDNDLGLLNFTITDAANREAKQGNHTATLHVGPLTRIFKEQDLTGT